MSAKQTFFHLFHQKYPQGTVRKDGQHFHIQFQEGGRVYTYREPSWYCLAKRLGFVEANVPLEAYAALDALREGRDFVTALPIADTLRYFIEREGCDIYFRHEPTGERDEWGRPLHRYFRAPKPEWMKSPSVL